MVDAYRTLLPVYSALEKAGAVVTNISGDIGGIKLEVIVDSEEDIAWISEITDNRFKDEARADNPVRFEVLEENAIASHAYNLEPIVRTVNTIPYEMSAEQTEGREGYVQPLSFKELGGKLQLRTLLRDFETQGLRAKEYLIKTMVPEAAIKQEYMNKADILAENPQLLAATKLAMERAEVPNIRLTEVRGGDESGAYTLSVETMTGQPEPGRRIPTINAGVFGENIHTQKEYQPLGGMVRAVKTMIEFNKMAVNGELK